MERTSRAYEQWTPVAVAAMLCLCLAGAASAAQGSFKVGDRVECDTIGDKKNGYRKATVIPYVVGDAANGHDQHSGYFYRVQIDGWNAEGMLCWTEDLRSLAPVAQAAPAAPAQGVQGTKASPATANNSGGARPAPATGTVGADRAILQCPIVQPRAKNGDSPNLELIKKVFRCQYGEKPARPGLDGAVTVEVDAIQAGQSRKWVFAGGTGGADGDGGTANTIVHPIRITFTHKTHYRSGTTISAGAIRNFRFYVNGFGEWQYGSAENIKDGEIRDIRN